MTWDLEKIESLLQEHDDFVITREAGCLLIANQDGICLLYTSDAADE